MSQIRMLVENTKSKNDEAVLELFVEQASNK